MLVPCEVPLPLVCGGHGSLGGSPGCAGVLQSRRTAVFWCEVSEQPALKVGRKRVKRILVLFFMVSVMAFEQRVWRIREIETVGLHHRDDNDQADPEK